MEEGCGDETLLDFIRATRMFRDVQYRLMGKRLLQYWRQAVEQFQKFVVEYLWLKYEGGQNLYLHHLAHFKENAERTGLGATSSVNDNLMEKYHQKYQSALTGLKAGRYEDHKVAGENWNGASTFAGKNRDAFSRLNTEALDSSPLKILKETRKMRDYSVSELENTWQ